MTQTDLDAYDRGFLAGANLRVEELRQAEAELANRRKTGGLRLAQAAALLWASVMTAVAVMFALK